MSSRESDTGPDPVVYAVLRQYDQRLWRIFSTRAAADSFVSENSRPDSFYAALEVHECPVDCHEPPRP